MSYIGDKKIAGAYIGTQKVKSIYVGTDKVYSSFKGLSIGGRIFYDDGSNGATYIFYDASGNEITYDGTIASLANATQYSIDGTPTKDRFYVFDNTTHTTGGVSVTGGITRLYWDIDSFIAPAIGTEDGIGKGKTNTATALAYKTWDNNTIFYYIKACNDDNLNGCNNWFIASNAEQDKLRESGLVNWYSSKNIWASVEFPGLPSRLAYYCEDDEWDPFSKDMKYYCFAARSF